MRKEWGIYYFGLLIFALIWVAVIYINRPDYGDLNQLLERNGYHRITYTGYNLFDCTKDDIYKTGFIALDDKNKEVSGTVCKGIFGGSYIRIK